MRMVNPSTFIKKHRVGEPIRAVRVTENNMQLIANWAGIRFVNETREGEIGKKSRPHLSMDSKGIAGVGDWVAINHMEIGFFTNEGFTAQYDRYVVPGHYLVTLKSDHFKSAIYEGTQQQVHEWLNALMNTEFYDVYSGTTGEYSDAAAFLTGFAPITYYDNGRPLSSYFQDDPAPSIPVEFVGKFYRMNPKTDELLSNGKHLKDGMVVLVESSNFRVRVKEDLSGLEDWEIDRANTYNRWAKISDVSVDEGSARVSFTAEYADGTKVVRFGNLSWAWFVRIDSLPGSTPSRHGEIHAIVMEALDQVVPATSIKFAKKAADTATEKIVRLLG